MFVSFWWFGPSSLSAAAPPQSLGPPRRLPPRRQRSVRRAAGVKADLVADDGGADFVAAVPHSPGNQYLVLLAKKLSQERREDLLETGLHAAAQGKPFWLRDRAAFLSSADSVAPEEAPQSSQPAITRWAAAILACVAAGLSRASAQIAGDRRERKRLTPTELVAAAWTLELSGQAPGLSPRRDLEAAAEDLLERSNPPAGGAKRSETLAAEIGFVAETLSRLSKPLKVDRPWSTPPEMAFDRELFFKLTVAFEEGLEPKQVSRGLAVTRISKQIRSLQGRLPMTDDDSQEDMEKKLLAIATWPVPEAAPEEALLGEAQEAVSFELEKEEDEEEEDEEEEEVEEDEDEDDEEVGEGLDKEPKMAVLYMHHISNSKKKREIMTKAKRYGVTGIYLFGQPGRVLVEGESVAVERYVQEVKAMPWLMCSLQGSWQRESRERHFQRFKEMGSDAEFRQSLTEKGLTEVLAGLHKSVPMARRHAE